VGTGTLGAGEGVALAEVARVLELFLRGLAGRRLQLEPAADTWTDTETIFLPERIAAYPAREQNFRLYKAIAVHHWAQARYGSFNLELAPVLAHYAVPERALAWLNLIEAIRLDDEIETIARQLTTSYHRELPVFRGAGDDVAGVLNLRKVLGLLFSGALDRKAIEDLLDAPYFVPATTPAIAQLQYFQEKRERIGLVVDEYGELMGLVTLEGIMEEIIGKFTTSLPSARPALSWDEAGAAEADGVMPVREVNRALGLELPTDGPKTLNGLILEHLQDIPEANVSLKIAGVPVEILSAQGRAVKAVRLFRPTAAPPADPT